MVDENDDVILISSDGIIIRMAASEVRVPPPSKAFALCVWEDDARIVSLVRMPHERPTRRMTADGQSPAGEDGPQETAQEDSETKPE